MRILWLLVLSALALAPWAPASASSVTIPEFTPNVVDPHGHLDASGNERVNLELQRIRETSKVWGAVFIVDTLGGDSIEAVAVEAFEKWKLGQAGVDNGLLLVLAMNDRESRFEVGYGLEGSITDVAALHALDGYLAPRMREGDVAGAIVDAFGFLARIVAQDPEAVRELEQAPAADELDWKRGFAAWGAFLLPLWLCAPIRNRWVAHQRARLLEQNPSLSFADEEIVKTEGGAGRWKQNVFILGFLSINPGLFIWFFAALLAAGLYAAVAVPLLIAGLVVYLSGRRYGSPERYRKFLDDVARQRAELIGKGHLNETAPGVYSYTPAYHASRASSSSSSGGSSYSSSSGGGSSGGGGASSRW